MSGDNLVFEESLSTEMDSSQFIKKSWVYVNDNNSQNYTSQVVIDTTPLSNAGGWINYQEGFIVMPLVVQLTADAGTPISTSNANYTWAMKNGAWNMLNSMTIEFNNQNIVQQTSFTNVFRSFKAMTSFSSEDVINEGSDILFAPDDACSWSYLNAFTNSDGSEGSQLGGHGLISATQGVGISNNRNTGSLSSYSALASATGTGLLTTTPIFASSSVAGQPLFTGTAATPNVVFQGATAPTRAAGSGTSFNEGMLKRQEYVNYNPLVTAAAAGQQNLINGLTTCQQVYKSSVVQNSGNSQTWNVYAKLRLKDLHDYFDKTPLMRGATIRMYLNTNQAVVKFNVATGILNPAAATSTYPTTTITSVNVVGGLTCPIMVSSNAWGNGGSCLPAGSYTLSVSIFKNNNSAQSAISPQQTPLTACRLYAPVYYMNALSESRYLSLAPTRQIKYRDIFQYQFTNVAAGSPFNFLVSNGINAIKSVLVVPFISTTAGGANTPFYSSPLNPCSSAPATPDPITLTNFNILISGVNLFLNNSQYDFENFREQLLMSNQLNANLTTGLTSGLIGAKEFSNLYRYYYGDCSRTLPAEENVSRSVQIVGTNTSLVATDLFVFVEFERSMVVDLATGARVE
jgi:hypothetical protein